MKPQLVSLDGGQHNRNLDKTNSRLVKGNSWKKQRIIVILPSDELVPAKCMLSWWNLGFPPNNGVYKVVAQGMEVGDAYSNTIEMIIANEELSKWEYILTLEHDNVPPPDGIIKLLERMEANPQYSCIGGLYFTKGEEGVAQIWGDIKDPIINFRPQLPIDGQLIECYGTGMGFNLWRLSMFKDPKLRKPWFKTLKGNDGYATQDLYAWHDFRKHGYRCAIDCSVKVGHYDVSTDIIW